MPASVPYDHPSLILGHVVDQKALSLISQANAQQKTIDTAQTKMNALLLMRRSLGMTINELSDLSVDVSSLKSKISDLNSEISQAATSYLNTRISAETEILNLSAQLAGLNSGAQPESPVDFGSSEIRYLPLASESIQLDSQFFSFDGRDEDDLASGIESYVKDATSNIGPKSADLAKAAVNQIGNQRLNHTISGTLIITASCTHKNMSLIDPLMLDPDKAIGSWNKLFPESKLDPTSLSGMQGIVLSGDKGNSMSILSGISKGSGFVGMVHLLKTDDSQTGQLDDTARELKEKLRVGGWLENESGGFGLEPGVAKEARKILKTNKISAHISMVSLGAIPSIKANTLKQSANQFIQNGEVIKKSVSSIEQITSSNQKTIASGSEASKKGEQFLTIEKARTQAVLESLAKIDTESNNVMDIESLMTAFGNYLTEIKAKDNSVGVPINFFTKDVTADQIAKLWLEKYHPSSNKKATKKNKS